MEKPTVEQCLDTIAELRAILREVSDVDAVAVALCLREGHEANDLIAIHETGTPQPPMQAAWKWFVPEAERILGI